MDHRQCKLGRYLHYKGNEYRVTGVARHSETEQWFVIYHPLKQADCQWIRPLSMFVEMLSIDGQQIPKFRWLSDD